MSIIIRNAKPEDAKDIQEVFYRTWFSTYPNKEYGITEEDIDEYFKDTQSESKIKLFSEKIKNLPTGSKFLVAQENDTIVGVCRVFIKQDFNQLQAIYVLPEHQRKGVGRQLWSECIKYFDGDKKTIVQVAVYNNKAIEFYKSLGFIDNKKRFFDERFKMPISKSFIPELEMEL